MNKESNKITNPALSAMFLALGLVLPFITGNIPEIGNMLLPMHIPVMLCGLICSWKYGLIIGAVTPLLRSLIFSAPPLFPSAVAMAFELAVYGAMTGFLFGRSKWKCTVSLYKSLLSSMIAGRIIWGIVMVALMGAGKFTFWAFLSGALLNAIPGIILQLILIPCIMVGLSKAKLVPFSKAFHKKEHKHETAEK